MVPRLNWSARDIDLRLPLPQGTRQTESFLAYRLDGLQTSDKLQNLSITSIAPAIFGKLWTDLGQKEPGRLSRAYSFRRTSGQAGLRLKTTAPKMKSRGEVVWTVFGDHADLAATIEAADTRGDLSLVELSVPPQVVLAAVRGDTVHHWSRHDAGVQIWLQQPGKQANFELSGWVPLTHKATPSKPGIFQLPPLEAGQMKSGDWQVKVLPSQGLTVTPDRLRNLIKRSETSFTVEQAPYEGTFQVRESPARAELRILTIAESHENGVTFVSHFDCRTAPGDSRPVRILMRHSGNLSDVGLELAEPSPRVRHRRIGEDQLWEVDFPPAAPRPLRFQLRARASLKDLPKLQLPDISAPGSRSLERWFAVAGPGLRLADDGKGLTKVTDVPNELRCWPALAQRIQREGTVWQVRDADVPRTVEFQPAPNISAVKVLLAQEQASLADGGHWLHQAEFLCAVRGGGDVQFILPKDCAIVDGDLGRPTGGATSDRLGKIWVAR